MWIVFKSLFFTIFGNALVVIGLYNVWITPTNCIVRDQYATSDFVSIIPTITVLSAVNAVVAKLDIKYTKESFKLIQASFILLNEKLTLCPIFLNCIATSIIAIKEDIISKIGIKITSESPLTKSNVKIKAIGAGNYLDSEYSNVVNK